MTPAEFTSWQADLARDYAAVKVAAGQWPEDGSVERARAENAKLLPEGLATPRVLLLTAENADGTAIGRAWIALDHPNGIDGVAYLFDIEVHAEHRGAGYGRALLDAVEGAARDAGADALELNVFGTNEVAIGLYGSSGYRLVTQQMRKAL